MSGNGRILVVEDDAAMRATCVQLETVTNVDARASASRALVALRRRHPTARLAGCRRSGSSR